MTMPPNGKKANSKSTLSLLSLLLLPWSAALIFPSGSAAGEATKVSSPAFQDCLVLKQSTDANGIYIITVCKEAVRCQSQAYGFVIAARAPQWTVKAWRTDRKQWGELSLAEFLKSDLLFMNRLSYASDLSKPGKPSSSTSGRERTLLYTFAPIDSAAGSIFSYSDKEEKRQRQSKLQPKLTCLDAELPAQVGAIMRKLYELPATNGLPLKMTVSNPEGQTQVNLKTDLIQHRQTVSQCDFSPPADYKKTPLGKRFFVSHAQADFMNEMFDGMVHSK